MSKKHGEHKEAHEKGAVEEQVKKEEIREQESQAAETEQAEKPKAENDSLAKIAELEAKVKEYEELAKRKMADFDNFRKRTIAEREQMKQMMEDKVITEFLLVLDNLDRALDAGKQNRDFDALMEGIESIRHIFMSVLSQYGVERMDSVGKEFDPRIHEALHMVEGDYEKQTVIDEMEKAFMRRDKVLRTGRVSVGMPAKKNGFSQEEKTGKE